MIESMSDVERKTLSARFELQRYCVSKAHYRYHKCLKGISYKIPLSDVSWSISNSIIALLESGTCALGISDDRYIIIQNGNNVVESFTRDVHEDSRLKDFIETSWNNMFGGTRKLHLSYRLGTYFSVDGIAEGLDYLMKESNKNKSFKMFLVLVMEYPGMFTLMGINKDFLEV